MSEHTGSSTGPTMIVSKSPRPCANCGRDLGEHIPLEGVETPTPTILFVCPRSVFLDEK